ncbi:MAG: hypothetical protein WD314_08910 [Trueperaceae bacterium]
MKKRHPVGGSAVAHGPASFARVGLLLLTLAAGVACLAGVAAFAQGAAPEREDRGGAQDPSAHDAPAQYGAEVYAQRCAVCHGATGMGLLEARAAFPADHRRCERCHRPGNPPTMSLEQIEARQHDLFALGDPPALVGTEALAASATPAALRAFLQATMPRYRPGWLSGEEYDALTAFLLQLNDRELP